MRKDNAIEYISNVIQCNLHKGNNANFKLYTQRVALYIVLEFEDGLKKLEPISITIDGEIKGKLYKAIKESVLYSFIDNRLDYLKEDDSQYLYLLLDTVIIPTINQDIKSIMMDYVYKYVLENNENINDIEAFISTLSTSIDNLLDIKYYYIKNAFTDALASNNKAISISEEIIDAIKEDIKNKSISCKNKKLLTQK